MILFRPALGSGATTETDLDRALGRAWRDDAPWAVLSRLAELPNRLGGHEGERRAADVGGERQPRRGVLLPAGALRFVAAGEISGVGVSKEAGEWLREYAERGRGWIPTRADTRDKVDRRNLRTHAMLAALLVRELAGADDLPRIDAGTLREAFREQAYESGMRAAGVCPDEWASRTVGHPRKAQYVTPMAGHICDHLSSGLCCSYTTAVALSVRSRYWK